MSDVNLQNSSSAEVLENKEGVSETIDTNHPHGEHEDETGDLAEQFVNDELTEADLLPASGAQGDSQNGTNGTELDALERDASLTMDPKVDATKAPDTLKQKPSMTVKPTQGKSNGPPTPLVKRILNSGTFGAGSVKTSPSKPSVTAQSASAKTASASGAPALKKSTSATPTMASKPTSAVSRAAPVPAPAPNRRASIVPAKPTAPPISKPSLSASASSRPGGDAGRASVASPTGSTSSVARPRASVSEAVKKAPLNSRQSVSAAPKPPLSTTSKTPLARSVAPPAKSARTPNSISSIREVKEDPKALDDLRTQLKAAEESLTAKANSVILLESQVDALKSSLEGALSDVESKAVLAAQIEKGKLAVEVQLQAARDTLNKLQADNAGGDETLTSLKTELEDAKTATLASSTVIKGLQIQIQTLESEVVSAKEAMDALRKSHSATASEATLAASIEHETLLKAQTDLKAIVEEAEGFKKLHSEAQELAKVKLAELKSKSDELESLQTQVAVLNTTKEESSGRLSELEIEILELKETIETLGDEREQLQIRSQALADDLSKALAATEKAIQENNAREVEFTSQIEKLKQQRDVEVSAASDRHAAVLVSLDALKAELATALEANEQAKKELQAAEQAHASKLNEAGLNHEKGKAELETEVARIAAELEGQEAYYDAKVEAVRVEHNALLQQAFERAKNEASEVHSQELQALRASSSNTIDQIQAASKVAFETLQQEHSATLESEVQTLNKQINKLSLELKATQDDLTKHKASLEASRAEVEVLAKERDEARAAAEAAPTVSPEHVAEVARLTQELSNTKDDLAAVTDMLNLTKASINEMSENHKRAAEEEAELRTGDIIKLRSAHDQEVAILATQKSELLVRLSDLEGELATAKASLDAYTATTKHETNGATQPQSPGVTKEELQRLHEAHNLKMNDMQAEHEKALKALREDLEASHASVSDLKQEIGRKAMEIQYLEQEQDENQEQITRLKEDIETLTEQSKGTAST